MSVDKPTAEHQERLEAVRAEKGRLEEKLREARERRRQIAPGAVLMDERALQESRVVDDVEESCTRRLRLCRLALEELEGL